jgi:lipopolysaccharide transport system ATP-binding protein
MNDSEILVRVEHVSKKFCRNLRRSLWYGVQDLGNELVGRRRNHETLRREEFWAVDDVSFELKRGECLGLIGHNGAGKTTLLRMLNGLITPDHGRIEMRGHVGALIALGAGFNPILSGRENIYINAAVLGLSRQATNRRFDEIVAFSGVEEFIDAPVQQYSSGMYVRLGFAVAAHMEPEILLVDEALAVGDIAFVFKCLNKISELRKAGTGVIFVTHNEVQLREAAQRCLFMHRGRLVADGSVEQALLAHRNSPIAIDESWAADAGYVHPGNVVIQQWSLDPPEPRTGEPLKIELELDVKAVVQKALFELRFWSATGQLLTTVYSNPNVYRLEPGQCSRFVTIDIPRLSLPAGTYRLAGGFRDSGEIIGWSRDIAHIQILESREHWLGVGVVPMQAEIRISATSER